MLCVCVLACLLVCLNALGLLVCSCIAANEKLQQHFNKQTFKEEEAVYLSEQIKFEPVPFIDNQPVLQLIEGKPFGLLVALDDALKVCGWLIV
jgi:myosin heavy subunit